MVKLVVVYSPPDLCFTTNSKALFMVKHQKFPSLQLVNQYNPIKSRDIQLIDHQNP